MTLLFMVGFILSGNVATFFILQQSSEVSWAVQGDFESPEETKELEEIEEKVLQEGEDLLEFVDLTELKKYGIRMSSSDILSHCREIVTPPPELG